MSPDNLPTQYEPGSRMILDAVLLTLARIVYDEQSKSEVAILPEMRIAPADGVQLIHPASGYEIWLSGTVDYAVVQYKDEWDRRGRRPVVLAQPWSSHFLQNAYSV